jgi:hypothetical protein
MANRNVWIPEMLTLNEDQHFIADKDYVAGKDFSLEGFSPVAFSLEAVPFVVHEARLAAKGLAESYRGLFVGAAGVFFDADKRRLRVFSGANFKAKLPEEVKSEDHDVPDIPKVCAEVDTIVRAENEGYTHLSLLAIATTANEKEIYSVLEYSSPTLPPCKDVCMEVLRNNSLVVPETNIITTGVKGTNKKKMQYATVAEMDIRHKNQNFDRMPVFEFDPDEWLPMAEFFEEEARSNKIGETAESPLFPDVYARQLRLGQLVVTTTCKQSS